MAYISPCYSLAESSSIIAILLPQKNVSTSTCSFIFYKELIYIEFHTNSTYIHTYIYTYIFRYCHNIQCDRQGGISSLSLSTNIYIYIYITVGASLVFERRCGLVSLQTLISQRAWHTFGSFLVAR